MAGLPVTEFELLVLLATLRVGEHAYGVPIAREIEVAANRPVARAVVYAVLERLERRHLVTSSLGEPTHERGGRAKRIFQVTDKGLRAVRSAQRTLTALWTGVPQLEGA
jgi:DNA-binding PadR family transcriptional regulator